MATEASSSHFLLACRSCIHLPAAKSSNRWANLFLVGVAPPLGGRCNKSLGSNKNSRHPRSDLSRTTCVASSIASRMAFLYGPVKKWGTDFITAALLVNSSHKLTVSNHSNATPTMSGTGSSGTGISSPLTSEPQSSRSTFSTSEPALAELTTSSNLNPRINHTLRRRRNWHRPGIVLILICRQPQDSKSICKPCILIVGNFHLGQGATKVCVTEECWILLVLASGQMCCPRCPPVSSPTTTRRQLTHPLWEQHISALISGTTSPKLGLGGTPPQIGLPTIRIWRS